MRDYQSYEPFFSNYVLLFLNIRSAGDILYETSIVISNALLIFLLLRFQSVIMLMFREEKSPEDEIKAWQFWHSRQHSVKQRILDAGMYTLDILQTNIFYIMHLYCSLSWFSLTIFPRF